MSGTISAGAERLTPVAPSERVELIDILRGFALLGILLVNFWGSSGEAANSLDRAVSTVLDIAVSSSFYPLFSFLFGLGFAMQLLRARERGAAVANLYLRRMLALFLIGGFHAVVIWTGDILIPYALFGLLLIPLHPLPDRWLWIVVAIPLGLGLWAPQVRTQLAEIGGVEAAELNLLRDAEVSQRTWSTTNLAERHEMDPGTTRTVAFASAVASGWQYFGQRLRGLFSLDFFLNDILGLFVLGLIVGRRRILQEASRHRRGLRIAGGVALAAAVAGTIVGYVIEPDSAFLRTVAWYGEDYGTTLFYVCMISLAVTGWPRVAAYLRPLAAPGRIALTIYLMQSTVMTLLFTRYGLGLQEPTTTLWVLINVTFFFGVQIPFSRWWIARYRFGPAEWVWRSMTYGQLQPMRLPAPAPATVAPGAALG